MLNLTLCTYYYHVISCTLILCIERDRTTYSDLLDYLHDVDDWKALAVNILPGEPTGLIKIIERSYNGDVRECKKELFSEYMKNGDRSWNTVIAALTKIGNKT